LDFLSGLVNLSNASHAARCTVSHPVALVGEGTNPWAIRRTAWLPALARFGAIVLVLALLPASALGHAVLVKAIPAQGAAPAESPPRVELWFNERLEPAYSRASVTNESGAQIDRTRCRRGQGRSEATLALAASPRSGSLYRAVPRAVGRRPCCRVQSDVHHHEPASGVNAMAGRAYTTRVSDP
jgi:copper resistance protein C